jgi:phenylpropionate dioxygenase-like ring-hydroxylating dioxygenase large terminal subunit
MGAAVCTGLPPRYPRDRGYAWFEFENLMKAPLDLILENGLDCSHTGFVHPGLFRSEPKQYVRALMQETPTGLRVETVGESREKQRDSRVFFSKGHAVKHVDEFIFPHTIRVDYLAGRRHFITVLVVTPESDGNCRVYTRIGLKIPYVAKLIAPISKRVVGKVIAQDKVILENQAANIESEGKRSFIFMDADAMSAWLLRMLRTRETEGRQFRSKEVEYKL